MALLPAPSRASAPNDNSTTARAVLRAAATPTGSWVDTDELPCLGYSFAKFGLEYVNDTEDSVEFLFWGYDGAQWLELSAVEPSVDGLAAWTPGVLSVDKTLVNTHKGGTTAWRAASPTFDLRCFHRIKASVKATGTIDACTVAISVTMQMTGP